MNNDYRGFRPNEPDNKENHSSWGGIEEWTNEELGITSSPTFYSNQTYPYTQHKTSKTKTPIMTIISIVLILTIITSAGIGVIIPQVKSIFDSVKNTEKEIQIQTVNTTVKEFNNWSEIAENVSKTVVTVQTISNSEGGEGSGVIIDTEGHILTNEHVVNLGEQNFVRVIIENLSYKAEIIGTDPNTDIAVIKLVTPPKNLTPITIADSNTVTVGQEVMALGSPLGLSDTVTTGIVSGTERPVITNKNNSKDNDIVVTNAIQTSAPINPGNSGGALINTDGELIGINSSIATVANPVESKAGSIGIGFAIPSNQANKIAKELLSKGKVDHAYLGITTIDTLLYKDSTKNVGVLGVLVKSVGKDTPAEKSGLKIGDTIVKYNNKTLHSKNSLVALIRESSPGDKVKLHVVTEYGEEKIIETTLGTKSK